MFLSLSVGDERDLAAISLCLWLVASAHTFPPPHTDVQASQSGALICGVASEGFQEVVQLRSLPDSRGTRLSDNRNNNAQNRNRNTGIHVEGRRSGVIQDGLSSQPALV